MDEIPWTAVPFNRFKSEMVLDSRHSVLPVLLNATCSWEQVPYKVGSILYILYAPNPNGSHAFFLTHLTSIFRYWISDTCCNLLSTFRSMPVVEVRLKVLELLYPYTFVPLNYRAPRYLVLTSLFENSNDLRIRFILRFSHVSHNTFIFICWIL